jgi:hypothetical protein
VTDRPPFCATKAARDAFERWRSRVVDLGALLTEADDYVLGLAASREARLAELARDLARCKDESRRLRLVAAERLAAGDMAKALELLERTYGAAAPAVEEPLRATGTAGRVGRVVTFPGKTAGLGVGAQRCVAAVRTRGPLTKAQLRAAVKGNQGDFLRAVKEALGARALVRTGRGTKTKPYRYEAGR